MLPTLWLSGRAVLPSAARPPVKLELWGKASLGLWRKSTAGLLLLLLLLMAVLLVGTTTAVVGLVALVVSRVTWVSTLLAAVGTNAAAACLVAVGSGGAPTCPRDMEGGRVAARRSAKVDSEREPGTNTYGVLAATNGGGGEDKSCGDGVDSLPGAAGSAEDGRLARLSRLFPGSVGVSRPLLAQRGSIFTS
jgi:hypothetical protein